MRKAKLFQKSVNVDENIEIIDKCLDEVLKNDNFKMELEMQIISNDQTERSDTVKYSKTFNSQFYQHKLKKENNWFLCCLLLKKLSS